jgi:hypothetical protein
VARQRRTQPSSRRGRRQPVARAFNQQFGFTHSCCEDREGVGGEGRIREIGKKDCLNYLDLEISDYNINLLDKNKLLDRN